MKKHIKSLLELYKYIILTRVSQTFLQMAPLKEIKKAMAPFNKITQKLPLKLTKVYYFPSSTTPEYLV